MDALFALLDRLELLCEDRIARRTDPGAAQVQDVLRYRLTRLLVGDAWDKQPALKVRVLQLMFRFMVRENERLAEEARDTPSLKLGRSLSIGRGRGREVGPRRHSKWQDAVGEAGRMQGAKMLPLVKLLLLENMQLGADVAAAAKPAPESATPSTPGQLSPAKPASETAPAPPLVAGGNLDDLLGLNDAPSEPEQGDDAPSRRSSSPSASTPGDDPFSQLAEGRAAQEGGCDPTQLRFTAMSIGSGGGAARGAPRPASPASSMSSMHTSSSELASRVCRCDSSKVYLPFMMCS